MEGRQRTDGLAGESERCARRAAAVFVLKGQMIDDRRACSHETVDRTRHDKIIGVPVLPGGI